MEKIFIFMHFILKGQVFLATFCRYLAQCLVSFSCQTKAYCAWIHMSRHDGCIFGPFDVLFLTDFMQNNQKT